MIRSALAAALLLAASTAPAHAQTAAKIDPVRVLAHETFLAGPALRGRGSLTADEATAAAYVAAQLQSYGLAKAPGMDSYIQSAPVLRQMPAGPPTLFLDGNPVAGAVLLQGEGGVFGGKVAVLGATDPTGKAGALLVTREAASRADIAKAAAATGARLILMPESPGTRRNWEAIGGRPRLPAFFADAAPPPPRSATVAVPAALIADLTRPGAPLLQDRQIVLSVPATLEQAATTNAVAYLPGTDPSARLILLTAHLDHLGVGDDGQVWAGANDDASGVTALLEIARTLSAGKRPRRGVLFVAYGSEEAGGFGARWFGDHPPVPLDRIAANLEFEMLGARVPKLAPDRLQMTGFERSNLGPALKAHGALIDADPYPEQNYFRRSDNYALALRGVVAHTISGYGEPPTYHAPSDTVDQLDLPFMVKAIGSLIGPVRWLVDGTFEPTWNAGGRPTE